MAHANPCPKLRRLNGLNNLFRRFRRDKKGATAIEFGMLAMPFLFLMMMIVEMAMVFWTRQVLQETMSQISRTVLTGESRKIYTGPQPVQTAAFRDAICAKMGVTTNCAQRVFIDVQPLTSGFSENYVASMVSGKVLNPASFAMRPVGPGEVVIVRVAYVMSVFTAGFFGNLSQLTTGENVLQSVMAFKAEPYVL